MNIPSYRVNDGVCDCCDASDEHDGAKGCTDTCEEHGRELRVAQAKARLVAEAGYKLRQQNAAEGTSKRSVLKNSLAGLKARQAGFQAKVDEADAVVKSACMIVIRSLCVPLEVIGPQAYHAVRKTGVDFSSIPYAFTTDAFVFFGSRQKSLVRFDLQTFDLTR